MKTSINEVIEAQDHAVTEFTSTQKYEVTVNVSIATYLIPHRWYAYIAEWDSLILHVAKTKIKTQNIHKFCVFEQTQARL